VPTSPNPSFGAARLAEETRERFLREVVARVPLARLAELHLFAPIRQGGIESGVAVLAALPEEAPAPAVSEVPDAPDPPAVADAVAAEGLEPSPLDDVPDADPTEGASLAEVLAEAPVEAAVEVSVDASAETSAGDPPNAPAASPRRRHTVFTARYRLTLKGPDRGRWDVEVREEADAPLVTVEAVVRGVQQRSGDAADPERFDAAAVARLLGVPAPGAG
jgi:hypothetical protein